MLGVLNKLSQRKLASNKVYLYKEVGRKDSALIQDINEADIIILSLPIYENSVPGLVLQFFQEIHQSKGKLADKTRSFFVITNSDFPEVEANLTSIKTCQLFAREMNFEWMGGIPVVPGTLIGGKKLEETGQIYKRLSSALDLIAEAIEKGADVPERAFKIMEKPFFPSVVYRFAGRMIQKPVIKKLGKDKYFATPFISETRL